jgi:hypothetical protein
MKPQVTNKLTILHEPVYTTNIRSTTFVNKLVSVNNYFIDDLFNMKYLYFTENGPNKFITVSTVDSYSAIKDITKNQVKHNNDIYSFYDIKFDKRAIISLAIDNDKTEIFGIRTKKSKLFDKIC